MISPRLSPTCTPLNSTPCWLMLTVTTFSEKTWPLLSVPKMRTGACISLRGSRRLSILSEPPVVQGTMQDQIA